MGLDLDTELESISAPLPKIEGSEIYILRDAFVVGSQRVDSKALQTLRGYKQHWLVAPPVLAELRTAGGFFADLRGRRLFECQLFKFPNSEWVLGYVELVERSG